jgi:uncharacterized protein YndB with AHSA1/START domain
MEVKREIVLPEAPEDVWEALTDEEQLEEWFANEVSLDARPGGRGVFRWDDGEERRATVETVEHERRLALRFDDEGVVELTLEPLVVGTRVVVVESTPVFAAPLGMRALAACAIA